MTHDQLLAKINEFESIVHPNIWEKTAYAHWRNALRAVVELHKPHDIVKDMCVSCSGLDQRDYPCLTIEAIEKELA